MHRARMIAAGFCSILVMLAAAPAFAGYGAVAFDDSAGKYGFGWNEETQKRADDTALAGCNAGGCKVVFRVPPKRCAALATSEGGKVAWGGKEHATRDGAKLGALENCQKRTSAKCLIRGSDCNR